MNIFLNSNTATTTGFDILNAAYDKISAIAANCFVDWDKVYPLINQGQTECSRFIATDKRHEGAVKVWVKMLTTRKGQEYPVVTFNNLKEGESGKFNGYQWLKNQQSFIPQAPFTPKKATVVSANNWQQNKFNQFKALFDSLPVLSTTEETNLAKKGFAIDDLPIVIKRGFDNRGGYIAYALGNETGITCFQKIYDEKFTDTNGKLRDKDIIGPKKGAYVLLGDPIDKVGVCEGLTTGLSIYAAGICVAVALDAFNLSPVAQALSKTYTVNIYADNDIHEHRENTGIVRGLLAAKAIGVDYIFYPELNGQKCDFNDLHQTLGLDAVRYQLKSNKAYVNQPAEQGHNETRINTSFLPDMDFLDGVTIIKSTYGTGKTQAIKRLREQHPNDSLLYVSHLKTLCGQASNRINLENYQKHKFNLHEQPFLSMCINSIFKLQNRGWMVTYDTLVLDEIEQLLIRLANDGDETITDKPLVLNALKYLIRNCRKVICLDADISKISLDFLESCRPNESFNVITNDFMHENKTMYLLSTEADAIQLIQAAVDKKEPVLCLTNSRDKSKDIDKLIKCDNKRVINSDTSGSAENQLFMDDINNQCQTDLLTVTSPSMCTGVSIESGHYQHNIAIFSNLVNTPNDCLQQLERDRVTLDKYVYVTKGTRKFTPKSFEAAHEYSMGQINEYYGVVYHDPIYSQLVKNVTEMRVNSMTDFRTTFISQSILKGYRVVDLRKTATAKEVKQYQDDKKTVREALKEERIEKICAADKIDPHDFEKLKQSHGKTPEENAQVERFELETFYKTPVTPELVREDDNGKRREQIKRAKLAITPLEEVKQEQKTNATGKYVEDVNYSLLQHLLLRQVLMAVGINADFELTKAIYAKEDMKGFVDWCDDNREKLKAVWPTMPEKAVFLAKPFKFVGLLLKKMGLAHKRVVKKVDGKTVCCGYVLNVDTLLRLHLFLFNTQTKNKCNPEQRMAA